MLSRRRGAAVSDSPIERSRIKTGRFLVRSAEGFPEGGEPFGPIGLFFLHLALRL